MIDKGQSSCPRSLRDTLEANCGEHTSLWGGAGQKIRFSDLTHGTCLDIPLSKLSGCSVAVLMHDQLHAALTLIELDGVVKRLVLCPSDLSKEQLLFVIARAGVEAFVSDMPKLARQLTTCLHARCGSQIASTKSAPLACYATEWVLLTSGTTGVPKLVVHSLSTLSAAIKPTSDRSAIWATFYDLVRYGGLQILLRSVFGGTSLVIRGPEEALSNYLSRLRERGVSHLLGTPTHWRRVLMDPVARAIGPRYVRLSGEIADQAILDALRGFYKQAKIIHAFASTESGVAFVVDDGKEGFPQDFVAVRRGEVDLKIESGTLRVRSAGIAICYLGEEATMVRDREGFVDTSDLVEQRDGRCYFLGRASGVINVGGLKVYPEEIESVINQHPAVRMAQVRARKNPITGTIVAADVVLKPHGDPAVPKSHSEVKYEILQRCRDRLPNYKVPVTINIVPSLAVGPTGKLIRRV